ncbi:hypothetical protein GJ496_006305 [Pomphorhynchus laevis]|nr:hypothetical protein GJ496_006305 [Pomphorhynchus laevis]
MYQQNFRSLNSTRIQRKYKALITTNNNMQRRKSREIFRPRQHSNGNNFGIHTRDECSINDNCDDNVKQLSGRFSSLLSISKKNHKITSPPLEDSTIDTSYSTNWLECVIEIHEIPENHMTSDLKSMLGYNPLAIYRVDEKTAFVQYRNRTQANIALKRSRYKYMRLLCPANHSIFVSLRNKWLNGKLTEDKNIRPICSGAVAYNIVKNSLQIGGQVQSSPHLDEQKNRIRVAREEKLKEKRTKEILWSGDEDELKSITAHF